MGVIDTFWIYFYRTFNEMITDSHPACRQIFLCCKYKLLSIFFLQKFRSDQDTIDVQWFKHEREGELMTLIDYFE